jgi:hypothetical protein
MTIPEDLIEEAAGRLVDDREYMIIDAPDEVEKTDEDEED